MHSSIIHDSQKVEITQMSIQWPRNKQNTVQQYNGLLFSHKKKQSTNKSCNIDQPWKRDAKWEKPDTKDHI